MLTLGIESSCDDTAVAVLRGDREVLYDLISSQTARHAEFGGVVPEFAARMHQEAILPLLAAGGIKDGMFRGERLDLIAVTRGPGLMGSLLVGVLTAHALSRAWDVPLIGINHIEGHVFANILAHSELEMPFLSLIVSGGHTEILLVEAPCKYRLLGGTRDDAAGEAFDKAAKLLGLPYPGGPEIDRLAKQGDARAFDFPIPLKNTNVVEFSFSGLKTALLWRVKQLGGGRLPVNDLCASFQRCVVECLINKLELAVRQTGVKRVAASGGVAANGALRDALLSSDKWSAFVPPARYCTDNAAMIAAAGAARHARGFSTPFPFAPDPSLELEAAAV